MEPDSIEKTTIRHRDQKKIRLTGVCERCGATDAPTSRHHLWYPRKFDPNAVIEVCDDCDDKIHGREDAEHLGRAINAIQNLIIKDGNVWLGGAQIGIVEFNEDGDISINMQKR